MATSLSLYSGVSQVSVKAIAQGFLSCANCLISGSLFGRLKQLAYKHLSGTSKDVSFWAASSAEFVLWGPQGEWGPVLRSGMSEDRISGWWKEEGLVELWRGTCFSFHAVDGVDVSFEVVFENFVFLPLGTIPPTGLIGVGILLPINMLSWAGFSRIPFFAFLQVGRVGFPERGRAVFDWGVGAFDYGLIRVSTILGEIGMLDRTAGSIFKASASEDN